MKLRGFSYATGDKFRGFLRDISARSLSQTLNRRALEGHEFIWDVYCDQVVDLPHWLCVDYRQATEIHADLMNTVYRAYEAGETFLMLPPDIFHGDGSIRNLLECAYNDNTCIAAPHIRVSETFGEAVKGTSDIRNPELVSLSLKHMHASWKHCFIDYPENVTYSGGVLVKRLAEEHFVVQHMLPNCWLARFNESDVKLLEKGPLGAWDWLWPENLIEGGRLRILGSSDLFFAAEMTPDDTHVPPFVRKAIPPDAFFEDRSHHATSRLTMFSMRGVKG